MASLVSSSDKDLPSNRAPRVLLNLGWFVGSKEIISKGTKGLAEGESF